MRKLTLLSILLLTTTFCTANAYQFSTFQPLSPLQPLERLKPVTSQNAKNYSPEKVYETMSYPKIDSIEQSLFSGNYTNEDIYNRLSRIEKRLFRQTFQNMDLSQRVDNITNNIDSGVLYNIPANQLAKIESKLFNKVYGNDDSETRIIRLEKEMLGAMQQGDLRERYETVANAAKHYNAFPTEYQMKHNTYNSYQQPFYGAKRGILSNIMSAFGGGTMTGFTPPFYSYNQQPYYNNFYNGYNRNNIDRYPTNGAGIINQYRTNNGYYLENRNIGRGSSVTILD